VSIRISAELSHLCPLDEVISHATALEAQGFYRVWIPDTVVSAWEAWMAASLILQHTQRLQVGLGVTNPYTRHPVVVAQMAATLQVYSGGRLAMSLGRGIGIFHEPSKVVDSLFGEARHLTEFGVANCQLGFERSRGIARFLDKAGVTQRETAVEECAAMGPSGWASAMRVGDGVATVWREALAETRLKFMAERVIPSAVLIPFAQSRPDFFARCIATLEQLEQRVEVLEAAGFDEVIVAYAEMADLRTAAQLVST